jgi:hypothetical protein
MAKPAWSLICGDCVFMLGARFSPLVLAVEGEYSSLIKY